MEAEKCRWLESRYANVETRANGRVLLAFLIEEIPGRLQFSLRIPALSDEVISMSLQTFFKAAVTLAISVLICRPASSQNLVDVRGTIGSSKTFLDEPFGPTGGGAVLFHFGKRFAVGPEFLFSKVRGFHDQSILATGSFFLSQPNRATPYLTGSIGVVRDHDTRIDFTSREWSGAGGAGIRISIHRGLFIAPEGRIGSHAFPMATVHLGYSF
jgi:hypothetical protein